MIETANPAGLQGAKTPGIGNAEFKHNFASNSQKNQAVFDAGAILAAIEQAGITPPPGIIPDENIKRFSSNGDKSDLSGWYIAFPNGGCIFGDWHRQGENFKVKPEGFDAWDAPQREQYRQKIEAAKAKADEQRKQDREQAAKKAALLWESLKPAPADHLYLKAKQIEPCGARVDNYGNIVLPVMDAAGKIHSLQFIDRDGNKRFLNGGEVAGHFFKIEGEGDILYICEGFATGASIHKATGCAVVVAFNAGNLLTVAKSMSGGYHE